MSSHQIMLELIDLKIENHKLKIKTLEKTRKNICLNLSKEKTNQIKIDDIFIRLNKKLEQHLLDEKVNKEKVYKEKKECSECRRSVISSFRCDNEYCCNY